MTFVLPDSEFGKRAARRLREDMIGWITSVDAAGTPQPAPVWFHWDEETSTALVYSQPSAKRVERARANPRTSLHLNDDGRGRNVIVLTGELAEADNVPPADRNERYIEKYREWATNAFGSPEKFAGLYTVPLVFRATGIRGH